MSDARLRELERRWRQTGAAPDEAAYREALRRTSDGVYFVYRSVHERPTGKRVVKLPGASVLEWFQRAWREVTATRSKLDPHLLVVQHVERWLKGRVHGFDSLFRAALQERLPVPTTNEELRAALDRWLYVEGEARFDGETLRVLTDDEAVGLAYYFFPASWAAAHPDRADFLLRPAWRLPTAAGEGGFSPPFEVPALEPAGEREGATYLAFLLVEDDGHLVDLAADRRLVVLPGARLPDLAEYLREAEADDWPRPLLALRAALGPREREVRAALRRCADVDWEWLAGLSDGTYEDVRDALGDVAPGVMPRARGPSRAACARHVAQLWRGDDQWFLFDDAWAAAHPHLATSLLRWSRTWDPLGD